MRCLELYSGIGGFAVAAQRLGWSVVRSIDINQLASEVYQLNFPNQEHQIRTIESLPVDELAEIEADLWWMSPPCQPFTCRGKQKGVDDRRCESLLRLMHAISTIRPSSIALENVPGFASSTAAVRLKDLLTGCGYQFSDGLLCPTQLGVPNCRLRYFLVAASNSRRQHCQLPLTSSPSLPPGPGKHDGVRIPLTRYLERESSEDLFADDIVSTYAGAIDVVSVDDPKAVTACFTSAYGKSPVRSGSYLREGGRLRRFAPAEILRLLGFPENFRFPSTLTLRQKWKLIGNSLSIHAVEHCLTAFVA